MKWSWQIARVSGIGIYIHATFLILVAFVAISHLTRDPSVTAALVGVLFILALFFFVVLHELGHAFAARRFGIRTRDITLLPIGGLARLERMPEKPMQELWVALAGHALVELTVKGRHYEDDADGTPFYAETVTLVPVDEADDADVEIDPATAVPSSVPPAPAATEAVPAPAQTTAKKKKKKKKKKRRR